MNDEDHEVLDKVFSIGMAVFKDPEKVRQFLHRPHQMLDGKTPFEKTLHDSDGASSVIDLMGRLVSSVAV